MEQKIKAKRGFQVLSPDVRKKIASQGGKAAHASGKAHALSAEERSAGGQHSTGNFKFNAERAREAGRLGGKASQSKRKVSIKQPPIEAQPPDTLVQY